MRLIDADALIKAIDPMYKAKKDIVADTFAEGCMQFEKLIKQQPTINQWIPMGERLPDGKEDSYLVTRTDGKYTWVEEGDFVIDEFLFIGDEYRFNLKRRIENIAWMPLPEPYKESDE